MRAGGAADRNPPPEGGGGAGVTGPAARRGAQGERGRVGAEAASASSGPRPTGYLGGQPLPLAVCQAQPPGAPRGSRRLAGGRITGQPRGRGPAERRCGRRGARGGPAGSRGQAASRDANARAAGGLSGGLCPRTPRVVCGAGWRRESRPPAPRRLAGFCPAGNRGARSAACGCPPRVAGPRGGSAATPCDPGGKATWHLLSLARYPRVLPGMKGLRRGDTRFTPEPCPAYLHTHLSGTRDWRIEKVTTAPS